MVKASGSMIFIKFKLAKKSEHLAPHRKILT